jgi:hypothetical protein
MYRNSSDLELVEDKGTQTVGLRFKKVNIPQGANITNAYIQFTVDETSDNYTKVRIFGEDSDDAESFTGKKLLERNKTNKSASWTIDAWNVKGHRGKDQRTPTLKYIVKEIIDRPGWRQGSDMAFIITGSGKRIAESYDGSESNAPMLHVQYEYEEDDVSVPQTGGVKIAFTGDTGHSRSKGWGRVLNLIARENADLTLVAGDTSYNKDRDEKWDRMIRDRLSSSDPVLIAAGNHDYEDSDFDDVKSYGLKRLGKSDLDGKCEGDYAEKMVCEYKNVYIVISSIGSDGRSKSGHVRFIKDSLKKAPKGKWPICMWHVNQRKMQVGGKRDEAGWEAYEACREAGAIIATGHQHNYSRTHLLSSTKDQIVSDRSSPYTIEKGENIVFVSGLGGVKPRPQERGGDWWASIYTASQDAKHGALFATFGEDKAQFEFINIDGEVIDKFELKMGSSLKN